MRISGLEPAVHRGFGGRTVARLAADRGEPPALGGQRQEGAVAVGEIGLGVGECSSSFVAGPARAQPADRVTARLALVRFERLAGVRAELAARGGPSPARKAVKKRSVAAPAATGRSSGRSRTKTSAVSGSSISAERRRRMQRGSRGRRSLLRCAAHVVERFVAGRGAARRAHLSRRRRWSLACGAAELRVAPGRCLERQARTFSSGSTRTGSAVSTAIRATASTGSSAGFHEHGDAIEFVQAAPRGTGGVHGLRAREVQRRRRRVPRDLRARARSASSTGSTTRKLDHQPVVAIVGQQQRLSLGCQLPAGGRLGLAVQGRRERVRPGRRWCLGRSRT